MNRAAIVFDLDGTLVDSIADIITHLNGALVDHGLPTHAPAAVRAWVGHGAEQLVRKSLPDGERVPEVLATFRARYRARPVIETRVYDGLPALLDQLARTHALGVLSNKPHELTVAVVAQVLARWPFAAVHGQRADHPRKPDPEALWALCRELDVAPSACVLVGDSEVDIETARAAGARSVGVTWGLRETSVLEDARPDALVRTVDELAQVLRAR